LEREQKTKEMQLEREKLEFERHKAKQLLRREDEKVAIEKASFKFREQKDNDEAAKLKKYADALKGTIARQSNDPLETVAFFRSVEQLFADFKVPTELQAVIIIPFLSDRAKNLVAKMEPGKASVQ